MNPVRNPKKSSQSPNETQAARTRVSNGMKDLHIIPRVSEKAYAMSQVDGPKTYIFDAPLSANKHSIARAVTETYEVTVVNVRTVVQKGKAKMTYRKGSRPQEGRRSDIKKAYVTLKQGDSLPLFEEIAAEEAKVAEAEEKQAKKEAKKAKKEAK